VVVAFGCVGCSAVQRIAAPPASAPSSTGVSAAAAEWSGDGVLAAPGQSSNAVTYNPALAPDGARLAVTITQADGLTTATFDASGLLPDRGYAVHMHAKACGATGEAAGPHFQHRMDPAATSQQPSSNPDYANPTNEIWLDLHTDAHGAGNSITRVPFVFTDRVPASVVVHEKPVTETVPGQAGKAGARVACLTLPTK
jgi:Cu-Zn family superoxide dismutase